jgi:hypothetical protein
MDLTDDELLALKSMLDTANDAIRHGQYEDDDEEAVYSLNAKMNAEAYKRRTAYNAFFWATKPEVPE